MRNVESTAVPLDPRTYLWDALLKLAIYHTHNFVRSKSRTLLMHQGELFHVVRLAPTPVLNRRWYISYEAQNV